MSFAPSYDELAEEAARLLDPGEVTLTLMEATALLGYTKFRECFPANGFLIPYLSASKKVEEANSARRHS